MPNKTAFGLAIVCLQLFSMARAQEPTDADFTKAVELSNASKYKESAATLEPFLKKDPNNFAGWCLLGYIYLNLHELKPSLQAFNKAHELAPADERVRKELNWVKQQVFDEALHKATTYFSNGDLNMALLSAQEAEKTKDCAIVHIELYEIYSKMKEEELATSELEKAYKMDPSLKPSEKKATVPPIGDVQVQPKANLIK